MKDRNYQPMEPEDVFIPNCCQNCEVEKCLVILGKPCPMLNEEERRNAEQRKEQEQADACFYEGGLSC